MKDPDVAAFIQQESLTPGIKSPVSPSLISTLPERDKFLRGDTVILPRLQTDFGYESRICGRFL